MGASDWNILAAIAPANTNIVHNAFQHVNVPGNKLSFDTWCRKVDISAGGSGEGRVRFKYNGVDAAQFTTQKDVSVRGLFNLGLRNPGNQCAILGVRMDDAVPSTASSTKAISNNGYHLALWQDGTIPQWNLNLYRTVAGVQTSLWSGTPVSGSLGGYKWRHLRLDFLRQPNGDAYLQVFESDPYVNPPPSPVWTRISGGVAAISELVDNVPAYAGVGFGAQVDAGAGSLYETYVDWLECFYSA
jgi:hypothetical protein